MVDRFSRRRVLQACSVGLGASAAGCAFTNGHADGVSPTGTDENPIETEPTPTVCYADYLAAAPQSEDELEGENYERRSFENLSSRQQEQFTSAVNEERPPVSDENRSDWYGTTTSQGNEHRVPLVVEYRTRLYETEVHHADYC